MFCHSYFLRTSYLIFYGTPWKFKRISTSYKKVSLMIEESPIGHYSAWLLSFSFQMIIEYWLYPTTHDWLDQVEVAVFVYNIFSGKFYWAGYAHGHLSGTRQTGCTRTQVDYDLLSICVFLMVSYMSLFVAHRTMSFNQT